ncbi:hypothetical protein H8790_05650 [Oscillibacter hominis]|uniref:V-type proton ATPase subunit E n=1 Tax=Oscillibacter hominis TaxID=2763056 RepID=A0A7G9B7F4_9FIRM|nr:V-type ATP synthase subunit E [Oscillibacter hominis]QNL45485.1 hypothetical protein H8790_05650 [Oscillibacter hominis]
MNGIDRITDRIRQDAQAEIDQIRAEAEAEAAKVRSAYQAQADREKSELDGRSEKNAAEREERLVSVAHMEARKVTLSAKQKMLDEAFAKALNQLCSLPEEEYVETLAQLMVQAAQTGREEVIFSPEDRRRVGKAAVARANELLAKAAAPDFQLGDSKVGALLNKVATSVSALAQGTAMLTLSEKTRDVRGGFILADQNVEVNCTFETLVRLQKNEIAGEVAKILFS